MEKNEIFLKKATEKHGDRYDYSKVEYRVTRDYVTIICKIHGEFTQKANDHMNLGRGCNKCALGDRIKTQEHVLKQFSSVHGEAYDYSNVKYVNNKKNVKIKCRIHGEFEQTPKQHIRGNGCPKCAIIKSTDFNRDSLENFIGKSTKVHGNKYDYSEVIYVNSKTKVKITCDKGHAFEQIPNSHTQGNGCIVCFQNCVTSKNEKEMLNFIKNVFHGKVLNNVKNIITPHELDIFIPELNLAIEYNGLFYHSERNKPRLYHYNKYLACKNKGIRLIQIWENEWIENRNLCMSFIKSIILPSKKLYARKLDIKLVDVSEQREFLNSYHFQGYSSSSLCYGLYYGGVLMQLMSFKKLNSNMDYEIGRLCTRSTFSVVGGSERLLQRLLKETCPKTLISFNNLDKFSGEVYNRIGMKLVSERTESYFYTKDVRVFSRQKFQKHKLIAKGYDPSLTEVQIANLMGFNRVFPTGSSKYFLKL